MSIPSIENCFPESDVLDSTRFPPSIGLLYYRRFSSLMFLSQYKIQGRPAQALQNYVNKQGNFTAAEIPEMRKLITISNHPQEMIDFLADKFKSVYDQDVEKNKTMIAKKVNEAYKKLKTTGELSKDDVIFIIKKE